MFNYRWSIGYTCLEYEVIINTNNFKVWRNRNGDKTMSINIRAVKVDDYIAISKIRKMDGVKNNILSTSD